MRPLELNMTAFGSYVEETIRFSDCQTQTPSYAGENGINSSVEAGESLR